jgi:hypothetical protein
MPFISFKGLGPRAEVAWVRDERGGGLEVGATLTTGIVMLKGMSRYRIGIEGHAVLTHWQDKAKAEAEQRDSLIPLYKARSEAIKAALAKYSIPAWKGSDPEPGISAVQRRSSPAPPDARWAPRSRRKKES